jgi:hypothetical protein
MLSSSSFLPDLNSLLVTIGPFFGGVAIRIKEPPIVKSQLGAAGETYNNVRFTLEKHVCSEAGSRRKHRPLVNVGGL